MKRRLRIPGHSAAFWLGVLYVPLAVQLVWLKILRRPYPLNSWSQVFEALDLVRSDILFATALFLFWRIVLTRPFRSPVRTSLTVVAIVAWWVVAFLDSVAHGYFLVSGGTVLDLDVILFGVTNLGQLGPDIAGATPAHVTVVWVFVTALAVAWLIARPWRRIRIEPVPERPWPSAAIALVAVALACAPGLYYRDAAVTRNLTLSAALEAFGGWTEPKKTVATHHFPVSATLEQRTPGAPKKNLVFIVLESVRASSTSVHDPSVESTPFLAELAKQSLVLENSRTTVPRTSKALVSILCGIWPEPAMAIPEALPDGLPGRCLPSLLNDQGYSTGYIQSATEFFEGRRQLVANMGFRTFVPLEDLDKTGFEEVNHFGFEDEIMLSPSEEWIARQEQPFFLTYLTVVTHHGYGTPRRFGDSARGPTEYDRYLAGIRYLDRFTSDVIEMFRDRGLYENTMFVIVSDHGEGFGEHGRFHHNTVIYEEGLRTLTMFHDGGMPLTGRVTFGTSHLDLLPTTVDLLGFDIHNGRYPGTAASALNTERPMFSSCFRARACMSVVEGDQKLIHHFGNFADELFNLRTDPEERNNLAEERPEEVAHMLSTLLDFHTDNRAEWDCVKRERLD